jgi:hypothetical protein
MLENEWQKKISFAEESRRNGGMEKIILPETSQCVLIRRLFL